MNHTEGKLEQHQTYPWELWIGDSHIATVHGSQLSANEKARRLCLCWNMHDRLLEGIQRVVELMDEEPAKELLVNLLAEAKND
jgi:hypothetical protein